MLYVKLCWILAPWFWRKLAKVFSLFTFCHYYLPFERDVALPLIKLDSLYPGIVCSKISWNWTSGSGEEDLLKSHQCIFTPLMSLLSPLEKTTWPFVQQFWMLYAKFGWNWVSVSGKENKKLKFYTQTNDKVTWAFSSG